MRAKTTVENDPDLIAAESFVPVPVGGFTGKTVDTGNGATLEIGCGPSWPLPSITLTPTDGTPLTTTKMKAGPGTITAGLGGSCETCTVALAFCA